MRVAFYAPLNAPDSPIPSGDRQLARTILQALALCGHRVEVMSRLRTLDLEGDEARVLRLERIGRQLAERLCRRLLALPAPARPQLWLTYHLYHKAPDWLGPRVADALAIPYAVVEASYAQKQAHGPWRSGLEQVARALQRADVVIGFKHADEGAVRPRLGAGARYVYCAPFLDTAPFRAAAAQRDALRSRLAAAHGLDPERPWLLTVGMMRPGPKLLCYEMLAQVLPQLADLPWQLLVSGDGPAEAAVRDVFARSAAGGGDWLQRVRWLGCKQGDELATLYAASDVFLWPAVKEPIGMVFVEAQAAGLPIVAGDRPGVREVALAEQTALLTPEGDVAAFAGAVRALLRDPARRAAMGRAGMAHSQQQHDVATAGRAFVAALPQNGSAPRELG
jgi:glycosyltransferase involved in cell wall biosynthesis